MAKLRPSFNVTLYPGTGKPPEEVELQPTDITPYLYNPEIAQMEADITKARYGGRAIQDTGPEAPPFQKPAETPARDFSDRTRFEQSVFKQIGGNPFEIDVVQSIDDLTERMEPQLFKQIFGGQLIWEDRERMNPKQMDHWQNELSRFRADLKERVESDKKTKIDVYNNLMKRFDNEAKEQEAALKKIKARQDEWMKTQKAEKKEHTDLRKEKANLLKRLTQLATEGYGAGGVNQTTETMTEITDIRNRLQEINGQLYAPERRMSAEHEEKKLAQKKGPMATRTQTKTEKKVMSPDDIQSRYNALRRKGLNPGQIKEQLKKEGIEIS